MKISITESGKLELKNLIKDSGKGGRVLLVGSKCSTGEPQFSLSIDKEKENDIAVEVDGIKIIAEKNLAELLSDFSIDYVDEGLKRGFNVTITK